jgi:6-phosphogluconolactonase
MTSSDYRHTDVPAGIKVIAVSDADTLAKAAADRVTARIAANRERAAICLTGGSSPKALYSLLASEIYRDQIPWNRVHWFIGDERFVAADDPLHNMGLARRLFLDRCAPAANIHPIPTDASNPEQAARRYEHELKSFYGTEGLDPSQPLFDLVLMGVGPDGHTASLFPNDPALEEKVRWVVGVPQAPVTPFVPRVTLTLPALNSCREMLFEVSGAEKRAILTRVLAGENLPANRVHAAEETIWLVDKAALPENFREQ